MKKAKWSAILATALAPALTQAEDCLRYTNSPLERALVLTESGANPYAIGVVGAHLQRQPRNKDEAVATALALKANGFNYSMGCRQVNQANLTRYGLDHATVFEPAKNSKAGAAIYSACLERAVGKFGNGTAATRAALSCYYSGNFTTGQQKEGNLSYVDKVFANLKPEPRRDQLLAIPVIPTQSAGIKARAAKAGSAEQAEMGAGPKAADGEPDGWDVFNEF